MGNHIKTMDKRILKIVIDMDGVISTNHQFFSQL